MVWEGENCAVSLNLSRIVLGTSLEEDTRGSDHRVREDTRERRSQPIYWKQLTWAPMRTTWILSKGSAPGDLIPSGHSALWRHHHHSHHHAANQAFCTWNCIQTSASESVGLCRSYFLKLTLNAKSLNSIIGGLLLRPHEDFNWQENHYFRKATYMSG